MRPFKPEIFTQPWLADIWPMVLRVFVGALVIGHGGQKLFGGLDSFVQGIADRGWPAPYLQGFMAVFLEFGGGILLCVGLFTRPTALGLTVLFFIITFVWGASSPFFAAQEKALMFMVLSAYIFSVGPGKVSVDHFLFNRSQSSAGNGQP